MLFRLQRPSPKLRALEAKKHDAPGTPTCSATSGDLLRACLAGHDSRKQTLTVEFGATSADMIQSQPQLAHHRHHSTLGAVPVTSLFGLIPSLHAGLLHQPER